MECKIRAAHNNDKVVGKRVSGVELEIRVSHAVKLDQIFVDKNKGGERKVPQQAVWKGEKGTAEEQNPVQDYFFYRQLVGQAVKLAFFSHSFK